MDDVFALAICLRIAAICAFLPDLPLSSLRFAFALPTTFFIVAICALSFCVAGMAAPGLCCGSVAARPVVCSSATAWLTPVAAASCAACSAGERALPSCAERTQPASAVVALRMPATYLKGGWFG